MDLQRKQTSSNPFEVDMNYCRFVCSSSVPMSKGLPSHPLMAVLVEDFLWGYLVTLLKLGAWTQLCSLSCSHGIPLGKPAPVDEESSKSFQVGEGQASEVLIQLRFNYQNEGGQWMDASWRIHSNGLLAVCIGHEGAKRSAKETVCCMVIITFQSLQSFNLMHHSSFIHHSSSGATATL